MEYYYLVWTYTLKNAMFYFSIKKAFPPRINDISSSLAIKKLAKHTSCMLYLLSPISLTCLTVLLIAVYSEYTSVELPYSLTTLTMCL